MNPFRPPKPDESFKGVEAEALRKEIEDWQAAGGKIQLLAPGDRSQPILTPRKKTNGRNHAPLDIRTKAKKQAAAMEGAEEEE